MLYISIYDYDDYKKFIVDWIELGANKGRGLRIQLAKALSCQTPYVTHVLSGDYHFSPEQGTACAEWMGINEIDTEYLLLLILKQRSATRQSAGVFSKQIEKRKSQENLLKKRLKIKEGLTADNQMQYYSHWMYAAIHMAIMNPKMQTLDAIEKYFQLPRNKIISVIEFLVESELVEFKDQKFKVKSPMIHLEKSSPLLAIHHANWRLRTIDVVKDKDNSNLHYTGVISLSNTDYEWVRSQISLVLEKVADRIKESDDEKIALLAFDWFQVE
jgi:uncharacterized protein (TIGR02147 family)